MKIKDQQLAELVKKHQAHFEHWRDGEPVRVFFCDGYPCVQYASGVWWHYDLRHGRWF